jgi:hypothetical protein
MPFKPTFSLLLDPDRAARHNRNNSIQVAAFTLNLKRAVYDTCISMWELQYAGTHIWFWCDHKFCKYSTMFFLFGTDFLCHMAIIIIFRCSLQFPQSWPSQWIINLRGSSGEARSIYGKTKQRGRRKREEVELFYFWNAQGVGLTGAWALCSHARLHRENIGTALQAISTMMVTHPAKHGYSSIHYMFLCLQVYIHICASCSRLQSQGRSSSSR